MTWQRGVARVTRVMGSIIKVSCPFCDKEHTHDRRSLGSKEVMAGCHRGFEKSRSYSVPAKK